MIPSEDLKTVDAPVDASPSDDDLGYTADLLKDKLWDLSQRGSD